MRAMLSLRHALVFAVACTLLGSTSLSARAADPLPSWHDRPAKQAILDFVKRVTTEGSPDFVPVAERIATFDNDGTLWCEMPIYVQVEFVIARVNALEPKHPQWKTEEPFSSILQHNIKGALAAGEKGQQEILKETHAGMTVEEFETTVKDWLAVAKHPRFKRPYTQLTYQPMLELLTFLRANEFQTFIVSGGGIEFMRPWTEKAYGIPPQQVVGSSIVTKFEIENGRPVLRRLPKINFIDDGPGKPVGIGQYIGRVPIMAFGNSDGDLEMLQYTTMSKGPRFGLIVHHTDAEREYAYDRKSDVGRLDKALDQSKERGWTVVSMKDDWKVIFPVEE